MTDLRQAHVLHLLAGLEPESVDCVITSPPYWGLRRYAGDWQQYAHKIGMGFS